MDARHISNFIMYCCIRKAMDKYNVNSIDVMDDPSDFRKWEDLEEEQEELLEELIGGTEFG